jgi:hypothetical protein
MVATASIKGQAANNFNIIVLVYPNIMEAPARQSQAG